MNTNSVVLWVILRNNAGWDCFRTPILQGILKIRNPLLVEQCAFLEVIHLFQQVGCARNKLQFHTVCSTESEIISLDAGLRLDGIPALDSRDLTVTVLGNHESEPYRMGVYHDTNGQNHGPVWKTQSFLSKGVCTDTHLLVTCGKRESRKFLWNLDGGSSKLGIYVRSSETRIISVNIRG